MWVDAVELDLVETVEALDPAETAAAANQFVAVETAAAEDPAEIEVVVKAVVVEDLAEILAVAEAASEIVVVVETEAVVLDVPAAEVGPHFLCLFLVE